MALRMFVLLLVLFATPQAFAQQKNIGLLWITPVGMTSDAELEVKVVAKALNNVGFVVHSEGVRRDLMRWSTRLESL
jgi:hypothetical protein